MIQLDEDSPEMRAAAQAAGWGSAALAYLAESEDRAFDFELWLTSYIGMVPDYKPDTTLMGSLHSARHICAHVARMLGLTE